MPIYPDPDETFPYVLEEDRDLPEDDQTVFLLAPLSEGHAAKLQKDDLASFRFGLRGWENFKDKHGNAVPFNKEKIGVIRLGWMLELAAEINRLSGMSGDDEKN